MYPDPRRCKHCGFAAHNHRCNDNHCPNPYPGTTELWPMQWEGPNQGTFEPQEGETET